MIKLLVSIYFLLHLFLFPQIVSAQLYPWEINNFESEITLENNGKVKVEEKITVDFKDLEKHGIFRQIPYVYANKNGNKTYTDVKTISISRNNAEENYEQSKNDNYVYLKIGDPDKTISGSHTYQITYEVSGVLVSYSDFTELYWNVTGNNWEVPIDKASANIFIPSGTIKNAACYEGSYGSSDRCQVSINSSNASFTTTTPIYPGSNITAAASFDNGTVPILKVESFSQKLFSPLNMVLFFGTVGSLWFIIVWKWWTEGRDFWFRRKDLYDSNAKEERKPIGSHETIVVEYSPPNNLRPAEMGTLIDQKADTRDVTATIIDLASRGYLKIKEIPKSWLFGKTDYMLQKTAKESDDLLAYEKKLYEELFDGNPDVKISTLKNKFYKDLAIVKDLLYEEVTSKKLFLKRPDKVRALYLVTAIIILFVAIFSMGFLISQEIAPLVAICLGTIPGIFPLIFLSNYMPRRTGKGRELYRRTKGYYLFIDKAEKHRQKFFEDKNLFNEVLPYAITFGLVGKFADAMKEIGFKPSNPTWYTGTHAFNVNSFGNSINSFSSSVGNSIASAPSSSGSSGGGFSGGGFGGGGGGSW